MEDLISKREVLEQYGISYGALYRWKRLGLIPEDWFLKRSAVTGQETFFRREQICPRVEWILKGKEEMSLEDLAAELSGSRKNQQRMLVLETDQDTREIPLDAIRTLVLTDGERRISVLEYLQEVSL